MKLSDVTLSVACSLKTSAEIRKEVQARRPRTGFAEFYDELFAMRWRGLLERQVIPGVGEDGQPKPCAMWRRRIADEPTITV